MQLSFKGVVVVAASLFAVSAFAGSLNGTYKGKIIVDRGAIPRTDEAAKEAHAISKAMKALNVVLVIDHENHLVITGSSKSQPKPTINDCTFTRDGDKLIPTWLMKDSKKVEAMGMFDIIVSKNEHEIKLVMKGEKAEYWQFLRDGN